MSDHLLTVFAKAIATARDNSFEHTDRLRDDVNASRHEDTKIVTQVIDSLTDKQVDNELAIIELQDKATTTHLMASGAKVLAESIVDAVSASFKEADAKQWQDGVYRQGIIVKANMGDKFIALCDTAEMPSPEAIDWQLVNCGMRIRGTFSDDATYSEGDIVFKDGATWLHDGDRLRIASMRGEKGSRGERGERGEKGKDGLNDADIKSLIAEQTKDLPSAVVDIAIESAIGAVDSNYIRKESLLHVVESSKNFNDLRAKLLSVLRGIS